MEKHLPSIRKALGSTKVHRALGSSTVDGFDSNHREGGGKESKNKVTLNIKRTLDSNISSHRATNTKVAECSLGKYNLRDLTI